MNSAKRFSAPFVRLIETRQSLPNLLKAKSANKIPEGPQVTWLRCKVQEHLVFHAPTMGPTKGTEVVDQVVGRFAKIGLCRYLRVSGRPHSEVMSLCREADIVIDQLRLGTHGVFALEAAALGKPVLVYIRPDLIEKYPPDLPFVNTNPDRLESDLERLLRDGRWRHEIGRRGRAYVERRHDLKKVGALLASIYREL